MSDSGNSLEQCWRVLNAGFTRMKTYDDGYDAGYRDGFRDGERAVRGEPTETQRNCSHVWVTNAPNFDVQFCRECGAYQPVPTEAEAICRHDGWPR